VGSYNKPPQAWPAERRQSAGGAPPPHRRSPAPKAGNHLYREMGRFRIATTVTGKG